MLGLWLPIHDGDTLTLDLTVADASAPVDLSDVDSAEIHIEAPDGTETIIDTVTLANQTASTLRLISTFELADENDTYEITQSGLHVVTCMLTMDDATVSKTLPMELMVHGKYEVRRGR